MRKSLTRTQPNSQTAKTLVLIPSTIRQTETIIPEPTVQMKTKVWMTVKMTESRKSP